MRNHRSRPNTRRSPPYDFIPIAIKTLGVPGDETLSFFHDLDQHIAVAIAEPCSFQFLMQRPSVAIQRLNAACIVRTVPSSAGWDELFTFSIDTFKKF